MPSFFSKSVPDSGPSAALQFDNDLDGEHGTENTPSKPRAAGVRVDREHEPSPLDFLFKAAIDARDRSQRSPEFSQKKGSPSTDSKAYLAYRRPESSANGIFPLELEEPEKHIMPIGPAFATPYKDRMNALRSASSPSQPKGDLDEDQRKAKTEALKNLLLNPRPQRPASVSPHIRPQFNDGNVHAVGHQYNNVPLRTSSGPPTPCQQDMFHSAGKGPNYQYTSPVPTDPRQFRTPSSALRQEVSPSIVVPNNVAASSHTPRLSSARASYQGRSSSRPIYHSPTPQRVDLRGSSSPRATEVDIKKMEDDLRRVLKLDISGGIRPNGVQSSLA
jgi:hypothetical protein